MKTSGQPSVSVFVLSHLLAVDLAICKYHQSVKCSHSVAIVDCESLRLRRTKITATAGDDVNNDDTDRMLLSNACPQIIRRLMHTRYCVPLEYTAKITSNRYEFICILLLHIY